MSSKIIAVAGPTASGKTAISIALARFFGGEIVSADSMQIYRRLDIGTAKATPEEQSLAPHHMIDIVDPEEDYSVARYVQDASLICDSLLSAGKLPVLTGGTGLYIDSLLSGRDFGASGDPELRSRLEAQYNQLGGEAMLTELALFDPERASILHPGDMKRIIRAFEVYILSGETITAHDERTKALPPRYDALFIIPGYRSRELLYSAIDSRVDSMVSAGLFEEVEVLLSSGIRESSTALQAIGYKEPIMALKGIISREEAVALIKQSSRRYAKRQLTWFSRRTDALRVYHEDFQDFNSMCEYVIEYIKEKL